MNIRLDNAVAVVTGSGNGLGREYALYLAKLGAKVIVNDIGVALNGDLTGESPAQKVVNEIVHAGGTAVASTDSVTSMDSAQRIMQTALDHFGRIDILVNNAGILRDRTLLKMEEAEFREVLDVHLLGAYFTTKAALPTMVEQQYGRIVLTTSQSGMYGAFGQTNYGAAKLALVGFANSAKLELGKKNININCIAPSALTRMTESLVDEVMAGLLQPDYVAPMVAYLCSKVCDFSGEILAAGGNHFAVNRMVQGLGVNFGADVPSIDDIAANMKQIRSLEQVSTFDSGPEHLNSLLKHRLPTQA